MNAACFDGDRWEEETVVAKREQQGISFRKANGYAHRSPSVMAGAGMSSHRSSSKAISERKREEKGGKEGTLTPIQRIGVYVAVYVACSCRHQY